MQPQPENDFCNNIVTDTAQAVAQQLDAAAIKANLLNNETMGDEHENIDDHFTNNLNNNLTNNKVNNGNMIMEEDVVMEEQPASPQEPALESHEEEPQNLFVSNDTNNNSNSQFDSDFGPETDVDAVDEDAGEKEKAQFESKETEESEEFDTMDRGIPQIDDSANPFDQAIGGIQMPSAPIAFGSLENKIFEELSLQNPDLIMGNNPFTLESNDDIPENMMVPNEYIDNKLIDNFADEMSCEIQSDDMQKQQHLDFTEKKDYSFEREDLGKDTDQVPHIEDALVNGANVEYKENAESLVDEKPEPESQGRRLFYYSGIILIFLGKFSRPWFILIVCLQL